MISSKGIVNFNKYLFGWYRKPWEQNENDSLYSLEINKKQIEVLQ